MRIIQVTLLAILAATAAACTAQGRVGYTASYNVATPDLVYVSPGVYVIADYDYPVFYSNNVYWRYDSGVWYRSRRYDGGWTVSYDVPVAVRRIDRPHAYVHYRANARVRTTAPARVERARPQRTPPAARHDHGEHRSRGRRQH
jgi:hypothetical protein